MNGTSVGSCLVIILLRFAGGKYTPQVGNVGNMWYEAPYTLTKYFLFDADKAKLTRVSRNTNEQKRTLAASAC